MNAYHVMCGCGCGRPAVWVCVGIGFGFGEPFVEFTCDSAAAYLGESCYETGEPFQQMRLDRDQRLLRQGRDR